MREAFLCVLVHPDGRSEFRIFGERSPTKHFDTLCAVLAEARAHDFEQAVRDVKSFARTQGLVRNPQLAAFLDEDDRYSSEMTGATIGSDGTVRRQDGEPVVFPSFQGVSDALAPWRSDAPQERRYREVAKADMKAGDLIFSGEDVAMSDGNPDSAWDGCAVFRLIEAPRVGDALARGTVVHEYIERLLAVVHEVRELASCHIDTETGACHTHGGKCPYEPARMALADLDAHGDVT